MDPGSVGTSLHFDGREVQNLQELEYQKEEEQQQCELRQMLTNAFDLMDEDILSETSEECESHDGSNYQPDSSTNHGVYGDRVVQQEQHHNGDTAFQVPVTQNQNGGYQQHANSNHQKQYPPQPQGNPDFLQSQAVPEHFLPSHDTDFQYSSLPTDPTNIGNRHLNANRYSYDADISSKENQRDIYPMSASQEYYANNDFKGNYQYYSNTPDPHPQHIGNAYFTENRYTLEGRNSLDISYPNPITPVLDTPVDYVQSSLEFNQHYNVGNYQFQQDAEHESLPRKSIEDFQNLIPQFPRETLNNVIPNQFQQFTNNDVISQNIRPEFPQVSQQQYSTGTTNLHANYQEVPEKICQYITNDDDSRPNRKQNVPEPHTLDEHSNEIQQLKILNKARAHEAEELSNKYESLKLESSRELRIVKHQMTLLEEEKDRLKKVNTKFEESTQNLANENSNLKLNVQRYEKETNQLKDEKEDLMKKLSSTEMSIENLNMQIVELQFSDTQNNTRQRQEMVITGLQQKFDQECLVLTEKLDKAFQVITEKEEAIDSLNKELQEERIKASLLEKNECLRGGAGQEMYKSLQLEVQELKQQMKSSHSASRLGAFSKSTQVLDHLHDDSMVDLGIRKTLHFNSTPNISQMDEQAGERVMTELQSKLEQSHVTIEKMQQLIDRFQRDLTNANAHVDILRKTLESSEKSRKDERLLETRLEEMLENEEKITEINCELSQKLATLEEARKNLVSQNDLDMALKELDSVKEMYVGECEEREKIERKQWEEYEEKLRKTTDAFTATETELQSEIQNLQKQIVANDNTIRELELKNITAKYTKDEFNSSYVDNMHTTVEDSVHEKTVTKSSIPNNLREKPSVVKEISSDDSRDSGSLNNSSFVMKNLTPASSDSFEKSDDSLRSNKSRQSSMVEKAMEDISKQHRSEIEYVRQVLIEENKTMSINLYQKMVDMRQSHKEHIAKMKQDFCIEKETMVADFEKKQQSYLNITKPNAKLVVELQVQYLDAVKKIKSAVLQHVTQTNRRTAEKIKHELSQERLIQLEKIQKSNNFDGTLQDFL